MEEEKVILFCLALLSAIQNSFFSSFLFCRGTDAQGEVPLVDCCIESWFLMNAHSLVHSVVDCCIKSKFFDDCCIES